MLKTYFRFCILLFIIDANAGQSTESQEHAVKFFNVITKVGEDVTTECRRCNIDNLQWTYKGPNRLHEEITSGNKTIRKTNQEKNTSRFGRISSSNCIHVLHLPNIQFDAAGIYRCWENVNTISLTNVIVVSDNKTCSSEPELKHSDNILLKQNDSIIINCSFEYSADESCIVTPTWINLIGHKNLTTGIADMDGNHAWIHFKSGIDITNGTHFNLSFTFNCSFPNNSQKELEFLSSRYDFGQVPFTLFVEVEKGRTTITNGPENINSLTIGIIIALAILTVFLFPALMWKIYKNYKLMTDIDNSVVGMALPEPPMTASYSLEHLGTMNHHPYRNTVEFKSSEEATYEAIKE